MKISFPVKALEDMSEDGEAVAPGVGDQVNITDVVGTVVAIDGDNVTVKVKSVGGCECGDHEEKEMDMEPTEESVKAAMMKESGEDM